MAAKVGPFKRPVGQGQKGIKQTMYPGFKFLRGNWNLKKKNSQRKKEIKGGCSPAISFDSDLKSLTYEDHWPAQVGQKDFTIIDPI